MNVYKDLSVGEKVRFENAYSGRKGYFSGEGTIEGFGRSMAGEVLVWIFTGTTYEAVLYETVKKL